MRPYRPQKVRVWLETTEISWRPEKTCCHFHFCERPLSDAAVKMLQRLKIIIIVIIIIMLWVHDFEGHANYMWSAFNSSLKPGKETGKIGSEEV